MIPIIDLSRDGVLDEFRTAYSEVGFAHLAGHGVPQVLVDNVFTAAIEFHAALVRAGRERYSVPFFFDPNVATVISPLASCTTPNDPPRFEPVVFGDYLRAELRAGYQRHSQPVKE